jgi:hypothetical protein
MKPLLYGYQNVLATATPEDAEAGRRALTAFAIREGFALAQIFVESNHLEPGSALEALIDAVRRDQVEAVAVPRLTDLGRVKRIQRLVRERLQREAHVRILVIEPPPTS